MKKKMTTVTFKGTPEQEAQLIQVIGEYKNTKGALMPVLQKAQAIYGYLPLEVQKIVAEGMDVSLAEIYGVITFYSQFLLNPKGDVAIDVCMGTACYVRGAGDILDKISGSLGVKSGETSDDGRYSLEGVRCIGACGLAPVITINGSVYGRLKLGEVDKILDKYKEKNI
ncbi:MAG: NAD(P)H-dependent oxidoreductase subunit E [Oscillospiraceae bacterium]|nr:NAD(P)H-dependent oxidoreductase subunit E [Oscillospiraceae bacterium]